MLKPWPVLVSVTFGVIVAITCPGTVLADPSGGVECKEGAVTPECESHADDPGKPGGGKAGSNKGGSGCRADGEKVPCERDGRWLGSDGCYYGPFRKGESVPKGLKPPDKKHDWKLYIRVCYDDAGNIISAEPVWRRSNPVTVTPQMLAERAVSKLRLPVARMQVSPRETQLVGLPSWLWLDERSWVSQSATASVPGLSVTARAEPVRAVWDTGDNHSITCTGPGTPYSAKYHPKSASPDCGHTYRQSSAHQTGDKYRVEVTVVWRVSWRGGGESGEMPSLSTSDADRWRVEEVQTLITR